MQRRKVEDLAVPVHEAEGNTRGHPGCLSRVSDIDTQCCDPSRYLVRWFLKTVPWTPTICWPRRDQIAIMMGDSDRIARAISCSMDSSFVSFFSFCESANGFGFTVGHRRWGLTWDRITCDVVTARRIIFCNFLSFEYILRNCFIYPCRCRMFSFVSRCRQSTTL